MAIGSAKEAFVTIRDAAGSISDRSLRLSLGSLPHHLGTRHQLCSLHLRSPEPPL